MIMRRALALISAALAAAGCAPGPAASGQVSAAPAASTPAPADPATAASALREAVRPITGGDDDHAELLAAAEPARFILLGESSHGTEQYYRERARISERLVSEQGALGIAIEGEWSAAWRLNLYVRGLGTDRSADAALRGFTEFPRWMWPNTAFRDFVDRLRAINLARPPEQRVGIYGMDVYDLFDAADFVTAELGRTNPAAAGRARASYRCFASYNRKIEAYGEATRDKRRSCEEEAAAVLTEVSRLPRPSGAEAAERHFALIRSAASVVAAEEYFREAYTGTESWNLRDRRMADTVDAVAAHGEALAGRPGKVVAWAHNSHVGDARATSAVARGELNLGQVMRERHGEAAFLVGFFTASGKVYAASDWGEAGRVRDVRTPRPGSHEALFQQAGVPAFSLVLRGDEAVKAALSGPMLQRAIGVIYRPESELQSHYFTARLSQQFDAAIFFSVTEAVTPLRR